MVVKQLTSLTSGSQNEHTGAANLPKAGELSLDMTSQFVAFS